MLLKKEGGTAGSGPQPERKKRKRRAHFLENQSEGESSLDKKPPTFALLRAKTKATRKKMGVSPQ